MSDTLNKERYDIIINCLDEKIKKLQINQEKQLNCIESLESMLVNVLDDISYKIDDVFTDATDAYESIKMSRIKMSKYKDTYEPLEPKPSEDVSTYVKSLLPEEYQNFSKKYVDEINKDSTHMTIGHLLDILQNSPKDTKILDVSRITYVMHKDGEIAVRFE